MSSDSSADSSSEDRPDHGVCRRRRQLPHGSFAMALKSSRLQSGPSSATFESLYGNPRYGNYKLLFCRTGWYLRVNDEGRVDGVKDEHDEHALLKLSSAGQVGHVHLMGVKSKLYLAFDKKGLLYGEPNKNREETVWMEEILGSYNTYMSRAYAHRGWYLALKKSGKLKKGPRTGWGQKATQFLPRNVEYRERAM